MKPVSKEERSTKEYRTWQAIRSRCGRDYGYSEVKVGTRWQNNYWAFLRDMGRAPTALHSIDRKNPCKHYTPGNCVWATDAEQGRTLKRNWFITAFGHRLTIADWARAFNIDAGTLATRVLWGWDFADALTEPIRPHAPRRTREQMAEDWKHSSHNPLNFPHTNAA